MLLPVTRDLAKRLLAYEAVPSEVSEATERAFFRVYEKLRRPLCALAGVDGFQSLASRALTLAQSEAPILRVVQITADGYLQGTSEVDLQLDGHETGEWRNHSHCPVARRYSSLFIGEGLTLQLVQDVWPEAALDDGDSGTRRNA